MLELRRNSAADVTAAGGVPAVAEVVDHDADHVTPRVIELGLVDKLSERAIRIRNGGKERN